MPCWIDSRGISASPAIRNVQMAVFDAPRLQDLHDSPWRCQICNMKWKSYQFFDVFNPGWWFGTWIFITFHILATRIPFEKRHHFSEGLLNLWPTNLEQILRSFPCVGHGDDVRSLTSVSVHNEQQRLGFQSCKFATARTGKIWQVS